MHWKQIDLATQWWRTHETAWFDLWFASGTSLMNRASRSFSSVALIYGCIGAIVYRFPGSTFFQFSHNLSKSLQMANEYNWRKNQWNFVSVYNILGHQIMSIKSTISIKHYLEAFCLMLVSRFARCQLNCSFGNTHWTHKKVILVDALNQLNFAMFHIHK